MEDILFEQWAIVELFGHQVIAGKLYERRLESGDVLLQVNVPAVDNSPAFTRFFNPKAIYSITPTDEKTVIAACRYHRIAPIDVFTLNQYLLNTGRNENLDQEEN